MNLPRVKYEELTKEKIEELKIVLWGQEHDEQLVHSEIEEAIESIVDDEYPDPVPDYVEVVGYARREVNEEFDIKPDQVLEDVLEHLDEEFGGPDNDLTRPTEKMIEAAAQFARVIAKEYFVWACEMVLVVEVDAKKWAEENRPGWLKEGSK